MLGEYYVAPDSNLDHSARTPGLSSNFNTYTQQWDSGYLVFKKWQEV